MRRSRRAVLSVGIGFVAVLLLAGSAAAGGTRTNLYANNMQGENEVPDPGDPDASGQTKIQLDSVTGEVCWHIRVRDLTLPASAAHIHEGDAGVPGDVVITLSPPDATGQAAGCTSADPALVAAIMADPSHYYVNVHNSDYPGGAVRDQLSTSPPG
jgi:hypothetical protein